MPRKYLQELPAGIQVTDWARSSHVKTTHQGTKSASQFRACFMDVNVTDV